VPVGGQALLGAALPPPGRARGEEQYSEAQWRLLEALVVEQRKQRILMRSPARRSRVFN